MNVAKNSLKGECAQHKREKREDMERWERYQLTGEAIPHEKAAVWIENLARGNVRPCPK